MERDTDIRLGEEQYRQLESESRRSGLSVEELVRRAVDRMYCPSAGVERVRALAESFGAWRGEGEDEPAGDGAAYVERLRAGLGRRLAG